MSLNGLQLDSTVCGPQGQNMKRTLITWCCTLLPLVAQAQAGGVTLNLDNQSPLSKWGRWTSTETGGLGYGFRLNNERNRSPMAAGWSQGDFVFKLSRENSAAMPDLFFGLKVSESQLQTTSLGCMSNSASATRYSSTLCGVQLDLNLP